MSTHDQSVMVKLGVALHHKYQSDAIDLLDRPLQEIADFINTREGGVLIEKDMPMSEVGLVANKLLGI